MIPIAFCYPLLFNQASLQTDICDSILDCFQNPLKNIQRTLSLSCNAYLLYPDHLFKTNFLLIEWAGADPQIVYNSTLVVIFSHFHFLAPQNDSSGGKRPMYWQLKPIDSRVCFS